MTMMHQCRFILDNKCTILVSESGKGHAFVEAEVYQKSLYFPLNFVMKFKLL